MPAGKSSERLAEEIAAYVSDAKPLFSLNPVDVYKLTSAAPPSPEFAGYVVPGVPESPLEFSAFFPSLRMHLQIESDRELRGSAERNWTLADSTKDGHITMLQCTLTDAQLTLSLHSAEIPAPVRATFSSSALLGRLAAGKERFGEQLHSGDVRTSWSLFARIVNDLMNTEPDERRNISADNPRPSQLLDLPAVLPFLGFSLVEDTRMYVPPRDGSPEFTRWLRRIYIESLFEITEMRHRQALFPAVAEFLGAQLISNESHLSPAPYGCLGCISAFSDDKVLSRFQLAMQNDGLRGGPWYLDALTNIAQQSGSEALETQVIELMSLGSPTLASLKEELSKLGLDLETQEQLSDDQLLDMVLDIPGETKALLDAVYALRPSPIWQRAAAAASLTAADSLRVLSLPASESGAVAGPDAQSEAPGVSPSHADAGDVDSDADIAQIMEETAISDRFKAIWQHGSAIDRLEARCALKKLGMERRSPPILALYEEVAPTPHDPAPSSAESYAMLGISSDFGDADIEAVFDASCDEAGDTRFLELRRALHVIAEERQSMRLLSHLGYGSTDLIDLTHEPTTQMPVGLWNTGNTCYLNSLLQFYYSLSPVREYVLTYQEPQSKKDIEDYDNLADCEEDSGGHASANTKSSDLVPNDLELLAESPSSHPSAYPTAQSTAQSNAQEPIGHPKSQPDFGEPDPGMPTSGAASVAESGAASASEIIEIDQTIDPEPEAEPEKDPKKIGGRAVPLNEILRSRIFVDRLGKLFRQMSTAVTSHVTPSELVAYMALIPPQEDAEEVILASGPNEEAALRGRLVGALQRQQDVTECIENVLYQLEATMEPLAIDPADGEQFDLVKGLFYGSTVQTLARLSDGGKRRTKTERFSSLLLDVSAGPTNIYDALDNYFADDEVELDNEPTLRTLRLKTVPEILQVQVQRVQFDKTTYLPYKNLNPLIFPEVVYLDRYLDAPEDSSLAQRVSAVKQRRAELELVQKQLEPDGDLTKRLGALATTTAWLCQENPASESSRVSDSTLSAVRGHYNELEDRVSYLKARRVELQNSIAHQFDDLTQHGYRIHALFIHKGDVSYGHYWIYIRDAETGEFYKYNDEFVSKVDKSEVFDFRENNLATPYFVVFVKV